MEVQPKIDQLKKLKNHKYELLDQVNKLNEEISRITIEIDRSCEHEKVPDRSYMGERTEWVCVKCGL